MLRSDTAGQTLLTALPERVCEWHVVVDPSQQGNGLSRALMIEFVERMKTMNKATIHLMCKERHVPLYEKPGFHYRQPSASDHGGMRWHEMSMTL